MSSTHVAVGNRQSAIIIIYVEGDEKMDKNEGDGVQQCFYFLPLIHPIFFFIFPHPEACDRRTWNIPATDRRRYEHIVPRGPRKCGIRVGIHKDMLTCLLAFSHAAKFFLATSPPCAKQASIYLCSFLAPNSENPVKKQTNTQNINLLEELE